MYTADLHIHSRYSRATSKDCTPEYLDLWARRKGIHVVGSGDFTHPAWRKELCEKLQPAEDGLYVLKKEYRLADELAADTIEPRFVITGEISSIYKKYDKVRKVHSLILLPGLEEAEAAAGKLESIGNIHSDGRPILGLDCHDLLEILLELCPEAMYVPAHIWTPHFSLFGAFSGFDSVEECYGDLSCHIHALETGLSSDPPMNWRVSALDRFQLLSNSDAHSPSRLGREANLLDMELSYQGLKKAIETGEGLSGTIEFFPEEGKYHYDGHRKCGLCLKPGETAACGGLCPVCGGKLTIGVSHRIEQLADREEGYKKAGAPVYESLVPLPEVIGASVGYSSASRKVQAEYLKLLRTLGPEFEILRNLPTEDIRKVSGQLVAEGIERLRRGQVTRIPGYDGEYGSIRLFTHSELENPEGQLSLFGPETQKAEGENGKGKKERILKKEAGSVSGKQRESFRLNERQLSASEASGRVTVVTAGPGTGKTQTLISHIGYLLEKRRVKPSDITVVTFTNQAAAEIRERLKKNTGKVRAVRQIQTGTFHSLALDYLKNQGRKFQLAGDMETWELAEHLIRRQHLDMEPQKLLARISQCKTGMCQAEPEFIPVLKEYQSELKKRDALDFDDLLLEALKMAETGKGTEGFAWLLVDEFQDISPIQYELIRAWNRDGRELFVIGDADQAIYGFRGSDARCFERLLEDFPEADKICLTENYRSGSRILSAAEKIIRENPGRREKLIPMTAEEGKVRCVQADDAMEEAVFIAKEINRLAGGIGMLEAQEVFPASKEKTRGFDEIAVLYRTRRQAKLLEDCLKKEGIPYVVAGRDAYLRNPEVCGTVYFFKSIGKEGCISAREKATELLWGEEPEAGILYEQAAEKYIPLLKKKKPGKLLEDWMKDRAWTGDAMEKLRRTAVFYDRMEDLLQALDLGVESDLKRVGGKTYASGAVTLMTFHGSKGLEFPAVILCGVKTGLIPLETQKGPGNMEEERRLFYVGMTRAREELILTCPGVESRFLRDIPEGSFEREKAVPVKKETVRQLSLFDFLQS